MRRSSRSASNVNRCILRKAREIAFLLKSEMSAGGCFVSALKPISLLYCFPYILNRNKSENRSKSTLKYRQKTLCSGMDRVACFPQTRRDPVIRLYHFFNLKVVAHGFIVCATSCKKTVSF